MGRVKLNSAFEHAQNVPDSDHRVHAQGIIRAFTLHSQEGKEGKLSFWGAPFCSSKGI